MRRRLAGGRKRTPPFGLGSAVGLALLAAALGTACLPAKQAAPPAVAATAAPTVASATTEEKTASPTAATPEPAPLPPVRANEITLPPGFEALRWADGLDQPTALAFGPDGRLFVTERRGRVWTFRDRDRNGRAEPGTLYAEGLADLAGIAVASDTSVYLSDHGRISLATDLDHDGVTDTVAPVVEGLPTGLNQNNGIAIGPDGSLYVAVGATCHACVEQNHLAASIVALDFRTGVLSVYATGFHNPVDLAFAPDGGLWVTDGGTTAPCAAADELNRVEADAHYGWPSCAAVPTAGPPARGPALDLGPDAGVAGLAWLELDLFPPDLSGGFFVALALPASDTAVAGGQLIFVASQPDGGMRRRAFALGFERPLAVRVGPDGALYVADAGRGVIYRIGAPLE